MNIPRKMVEAGARAVDNEMHGVEEGESLDEHFERIAEACLRAAIGCAEVVRTNNTTTDESVDVQTWCEESVGDVCPLHPGDTILIVRAEKGGGNG